MIDITIPIAFIAGVFSSLAPCVIPLLPAYVGYSAGMSLRDLKKGHAVYRKKVMISSLFFVLGFSLIFVLLGTAVAGFGQMFRRNSLLLQMIAGLVIIIFGLDFAGFIQIPFLEKTRQFAFPKWASKLGYAKGFLIGVVFALAWTPCVGAVLGSILTLAAVTATATKGAILLFFYSLGISIPFLVLALTIASAPKYMKSIHNKIEPISKIGGLMLVILGLLLLTNTYRYVNSWFIDLI